MVQLMPLHPKTPSSFASFKSRLVLPFWYRLTQVALEKRPLNGCSSSYDCLLEAFRGRLAWARDPKGRERNLGELVSQFQYNYDVEWRTWVYSDRVRDDSGQCTVLEDYKVRLADCNLLLPFICERGTVSQTIKAVLDRPVGRK